MSNILVKWAPAAVALGLLAGPVPAALAGTVSLQSLLDGGSIQVGNQTFTNFGSYTCSTYGGACVDPNQIYVNPVTSGSQVGLNFQSSNFSVSSSQAVKIHLEFDVQSAPGTGLDKGGLALQGQNYNGGNAAVNATFNGTSSLGTSSAAGKYKSGAQFTPGTTSVHVSLDITLNGGVRPTSYASIDHFTLMFDNPEPGSLTLLSLGAMGLLGFGWRRKKRLVP